MVIFYIFNVTEQILQKKNHEKTVFYKQINLKNLSETARTSFEFSHNHMSFTIFVINN